MMKRKVDNFAALTTIYHVGTYALLETRQKECPECGGEGQVEGEVPRPANFGRDIGELYEQWLDCEWCSGKGKIEE